MGRRDRGVQMTWEKTRNEREREKDRDENEFG